MKSFKNFKNFLKISVMFYAVLPKFVEKLPTIFFRFPGNYFKIFSLSSNISTKFPDIFLEFSCNGNYKYLSLLINTSLCQYFPSLNPTLALANVKCNTMLHKGNGCKSLRRNLRYTFKKELKKHTKIHSGSGTDELDYECSLWVYFGHIMLISQTVALEIGLGNLDNDRRPEYTPDSWNLIKSVEHRLS